jgi:hypothetical protein
MIIILLVIHLSSTRSLSFPHFEQSFELQQIKNLINCWTDQLGEKEGGRESRPIQISSNFRIDSLISDQRDHTSFSSPTNCSGGGITSEGQ